ncbi:DUF5994 family protein [Speluncibacter jeojiensis]|uniref:DUF5994 family protein n=1 Tax=Speluncibacter jeojiensis TaxID=2710754 RepID=A0A9X4M284_9ACTN|nr:DUF5994 family protein [Corynebacteriales bacterium D3-21]
MRLTPHACGETLLDGVWWPRTANLTRELHDLISAVTPSVGVTGRITFGWNPASISQRRADLPDGVTVEDRIADQPPDVMYLFGDNGTRLSLLIIPAATHFTHAHAAMAAAGAGVG